MALTQLKTSGIADDAVTTDKLANAINTERTANTAKVSTTINNNADNRVITGSGTANTLEGESNLTFNGTKLSLTPPANTGNDGFEIIPAGGSTASSFKVKGNQSAGAATGRNGGVVEIDANYYADSSDIFTIKSRGTTTLNMLGNGNLGIGVSTPSFKLDVAGNIRTDAFIGRSNISAPTADASIYRAADNTLAFATGSTERLRIQSGGGISFNGDTSADNALDDYEEGTFTCTITGSSSNPSYGTSSNQGFYVRIGKFVSLYFLMIVNSVSSQGSGNWQIQGLPFSHDNNVNSYRSIGIIGYNDIFDFEVHKLYVTNSDKLLIIPNGVTQSNQTFSQNPLSTGYFGFSITYRTDS